MRHLRQVVLMLIFLFIVGCSTTTSSSDIEDEVVQSIPFDEATPLSASFSNASVPEMKGVVENEHLQLLVDDMTGEIALYNKQTKGVWYSNPQNGDTDPLALGINKDLLFSQLKMDYYNAFGQLSSINSHTDAVAHGQINISTIENGIAVTYKFGTDVRTAEDLPQRLSKERFTELTALMDNTGQRALKIAYKEDKKEGHYDRNDGALQGLQLTRALDAFDSIGYTAEDLMRDAQEHNAVQEKPEPRIFYATIEYVLDESSLVVTVPVNKLIFPDDYPINMVSVLPFFGAGGTDAQGSLLIPDGSGALIHFNNGKERYAAYQQSVYGEDMTLQRTENINAEQKVRLPIFGMIHNNEAWLAIIEKGAAVATIGADISGRLNSYNNIYASFYVVNKSDVTLSANEQRRTIPKFQETAVNSDYVIRYLFLDKKDASYVDMANAYQHYLHEKGMVAEQGKEGEVAATSFYLDLVGNISKRKHFLAVPYQAQEALTTFDQADHIVNELLDRQIKKLNLRYSGWFNGGLEHTVPTKIKVDASIGGKEGMNQFIQSVTSKGVHVYPDVALLVAHSEKGFNVRKEASRTLRETPAFYYPIDLALDRRDSTKLPSYVISPRFVEQLAQSTIEGMNSIEGNGLALRDLGDLINSDYLKNKQIDRTESEQLSVLVFNALKDEGLNLMVDGGNAYTFPYASTIVNAPMSSSGFKITDETIPFYQMVIRGYIAYTGRPYNLSTYSNEREYILKSLEYGAGVHFKWIFADNEVVKDTQNNDLYAMNYMLWLEQAVKMYSEIDSFLSKVHKQKIVDHEKLEQGVYKTMFENGQFVIVNYNSEHVTIDGKSIEAMGYVTGGDAAW